MTLSTVALLLCLSSTFAQEPTDPARGIKSKDVQDRLAAIESLRKSTDPQTEKLLLSALSDRDWEVVEKSAAALADRGTEASATPLVRLCIDGDIRRTRRTAARTLAKIAPAKATGELLKLTSGKNALLAFEALAIVAPAVTDDAAGAAVQRGLRAKEAPLRHAAGKAIAAMPDAAADETLTTLLRGEDSELAALALQAAAASAEPHFLGPLFTALHEKEVPDVLERRMLAAAAACMSAVEKAGPPAKAADELKRFTALGAPASVEAEARAVRLYAALDAVAAADSPLKLLVTGLLSAGLAHAKPAVRKAALAGALRRKLAGAKETALALAAKDPDASVRHVAVCELTRAFGAADSALLAVLVASVAGDPDPGVREAAAVALGAPELPGAAAALAGALYDPEWAVATCAAVSLGKTRDPAGLEPLRKMQEHADWRYRGGATVGLTWIYVKDAIPALIHALGDADPSVKRTAFAFLDQQFKAKLPEERGAWEAWWKENSSRVRLIDPALARKNRERYGYASSTEAAFENLDVVVLESRGDNIQRLLEHLHIKHRLTQASKVSEAALQPGAIYVSNCTGEIETKDVERLAWYVRAGGFLFGSCWSLQETIERAHPGVLKRLDTASEVIDDVVACPVESESPWLKNVFGLDSEPLYHLEGSYLIQVLEPELCEVLIDSPQALEHWGGGNLAATFRSGHGLILDSANHFDLQGLEVAPGLKTAADRIAFAFDRMGLEYETWRKTQNEKWWDSALKASQNVFDWSALWFVTNFVRAKRLNDG